MKSLDEMSVEEVLDEISLNLIDSDMDIILGRNKEAILEIKEELEKNKKLAEEAAYKGKMAPIKGLEEASQRKQRYESQLHLLNSDSVIKIFIKYADVINKEYLVLLSTYNSQKRLETEGTEIDPKIKEIIKKDVEKGLRLLRKRECSVGVPIYDPNNGLYTKIKIVDSTELARSIKRGEKLDATNTMSKRKFARLDEIDQRVGLSNIVSIITNEDIQQIIALSPDIGSAMVYQIAWNSIKRYLEANTDGSVDLYSHIVTLDTQRKARVSEQGITTVEETLMKNSKYIDIDALLLIASYRYIDMLENDEENLLTVDYVGSSEEKKGKDEAVKMLKDILEGISREVSRGARIDFTFEGEDIKIQYSLEDLERDLIRFHNERYIRKKESEDLKQKLFANEKDFNSADKYELGLLGLDNDEIYNLLLISEENIIYAIEKTSLNSKIIFAVLCKRCTCSERLFSIINKRNLLSAIQIISLFDRGIIDTNLIMNLEDQERLEEIRRLSMEVLKEAYVDISSREEELKPEEIKLFDRYRALYKALNIEGKSEEQVAENSFTFISSFEDDLDSDRLEGLYQYGIISLDASADWGVNLNQMLSNNSIKPTDLKNLYKNGKITIDAIRNVLRNGILPYEEKLDLIYSTFDGETEEEYALREELVELLETGDEYKAEGEKKAAVRAEGSSIKGSEYITDPHARWKLISLLDSDYSKKFLPTGFEVIDGHRVFLLPNHDKIVIEKMHEKRHGRKVSAYASATYIMDTDEFFKNINELILDGAINRTALRELSENDRAAKIIHSASWGNKIKEYFGISNENERYNEEEIAEINKAIENVVKSRRERV